MKERWAKAGHDLTETQIHLVLSGTWEVASSTPISGEQ